MHRLLTITIAALALSACASAPAAHDLSGAWRFQVAVTSERTTHGALQLERTASGYAGVLTTDQGENVLAVQSFTLDGEDVAMTVISPDGAVTFEGVLAEDGAVMKGTVTYHNGQTYPMSVTRG